MKDLIEYIKPERVEIKEFIYFLLYKDIIIYIGKTINVENRIAAHTKDKIFDKILYREVRNMNETDYEEAKEILTYYPVMNVQYIYQEDIDNGKAKVFQEIGEYYFIKSVGVYHKDLSYEKNNILLLTKENRYNCEYLLYNIDNSRVVGNNTLEFPLYCYNYCAITHSLIRNDVEYISSYDKKKVSSPPKTQSQIQAIRERIMKEKQPE